MASGPRTNPWFQECGPRLVQNNEIVAFDTDLNGTLGMSLGVLILMQLSTSMSLIVTVLNALGSVDATL